MGDFLAFRRMISPMIIQVLFWIGVGGSVIVGLISLGSGAVLYLRQLGNPNDAGFISAGTVAMFYGLIVLVFGPLVTRICCELPILLFRMNETLTDVRNGLVGPRA